MNILITLCARGGSKGIPGKNIKLINGLPLIAYSIRHAQAFAKKYPADITLSTDSDDIKKVAAEYGVTTTYTRPAALASDTAGKVPAMQDVLEYEEQQRGKTYDVLLDIDVSGPMRTLEDLEKAFGILKADPKALIVFSVLRSHRNPYFNMLEQGSDGYYKIVKDGGIVLSRQTGPKVYDMSGSFYFFRREYFNTNPQMADSERSLIYEMPHQCFDLDHPIEFEFLDYLLREKKLDFDL